MINKRVGLEGANLELLTIRAEARNPEPIDLRSDI
jgi:hypothetical protein